MFRSMCAYIPTINKKRDYKFEREEVRVCGKWGLNEVFECLNENAPKGL